MDIKNEHSKTAYIYRGHDVIRTVIVRIFENRGINIALTKSSHVIHAIVLAAARNPKLYNK